MTSRLIILFFTTSLLLSCGSKKESNTDSEHNEKSVSTEIVQKQEIDYAAELNGIYILEGANCAGFTFVDEKTICWTNEIYCNLPDTLRIKWIDNTTFLTIQTEKFNEECPPIVEVYKVINLEGDKLELSSTWTGWGEDNDREMILFKE